MKKIFIVLIIPILLASCQQEISDKANFEASELVMAEEMMPITKQELNSSPPLAPLVSKEIIKKKIIKDGRIGIKVQELKRTKANLDSLVLKYGGYYANENLNNSDWEISYNLKIRIPSNHFENLITDIEKGNGKIQYKEI